MPECKEPRKRQDVFITIPKDAISNDCEIGQRVKFQGYFSNDYINSAFICFNDAVIESIEPLDDGELKVVLGVTEFEIICN